MLGDRKTEINRNLMRIREVIGTFYQRVLLGLAMLCLAACVASQTKGSMGLQPAYDRILLAGDIQVAEAHLRDFGYDPGTVDSIYTAETRAAVRAYQARYGLPVSGLLDWPTRQELLPGLDQPGFVR
jgi:hypothetical protein